MFQSLQLKIRNIYNNNIIIIKNVFRWFLMFLFGVCITMCIYIIEPISQYVSTKGLKKEKKIFQVKTVYINDIKIKKKEKPKKKIKKIIKEKHKLKAQKRMTSRFKLNLETTSMFGEEAFGLHDFENINFEEGEADIDAMIVRRVTPRYPEKALENRIERDIELRVMVKRDGTVGEIKSLTEDDKYRFVSTAINAVRRYKYEPAQYKGLPVNQWRKITIYFRIDE